jgi:hypothetical protein
VGFHVTNRQGASLSDPDETALDAVLAELAGPDDREHPDVSLTHDSEWCLSAFKSGLLVWENLEADTGSARHMTSVPRSEVRRLWIALAQGHLQVVNAESWQPGYG